VIGGNTGGANSTNNDRAGWDWDKWQKEDPRGLEAMEKEDKEGFLKLYNSHYKTNLK
jgi:hypothetical protein